MASLGIATTDVVIDEPVRRIPTKTPRTASRSVDDTATANVKKIAMFDFSDQDNGDELNFKEGELIEVLEDLEDGWSVGRNSEGDVGMLPSSFVGDVPKEGGSNPLDMSEDDEDQDDEDQDEEGEEKNVEMETKRSTKKLFKRKQSLAATASEFSININDDNENNTNKVVRALCDVEEQEQGDELILQTGDLIEVLQEYDDGWWFGQIGERSGFFPSNCVEDVEEGEEMDDESNAKALSNKDITIVGVASTNPNDDIAVATKVPGPPPKKKKAGEGKSNEAGGNVANVEITKKAKEIMIARIITLVCLLLSVSFLGLSMFGVHSTYAEITTYPHEVATASRDTTNIEAASTTTSSSSSSLYSTTISGRDYLNTAKGVVTISEGSFLGVSKLTVIPGTTANITSSVVGSIAIKDFSSNVVSISYSLMGLPASTEMGLRVEQDVSCSISAASRKGSMYDESTYGLNRITDSPWNGVRFNTDEIGSSSGTLLASFGYSASDLVGRTIVITDGDGIAGGCATIGPFGSDPTTVLMSYSLHGMEKSEIPLSAAMKPFPDYRGTFAISGTVSIASSSYSQLAAVVGLYPGYIGANNNVQGTVEILRKGIGEELEIRFDLQNLAVSSTGGLHLHQGTSCAEANGHYYDQDREDPWAAKVWTSDDQGRARGSFTIRPGPNSLNVLGRTVVIHDADPSNSRMACGKIQLLDFSTVSYMLEGVEPERFGLLAVHDGKSCATASGIGSTYQNSQKFGASINPWGKKYGLTTVGGNAAGSFRVAYGYSLDETKGRVLIAYDSQNVKIGCGVLNLASRTSEEYVSRKLIRGLINVHEGDLCQSTGKVLVPAGVIDTWSNYKYTTDEKGRAVGTLVVDVGLSVGATLHRTLVVHDNYGTEVGCGVLYANMKATGSIHPALIEHRSWLIALFVVVMFAFFFQGGQLVFKQVYESDSFTSGVLSESHKVTVITYVLLGMFVLSWFLLGESIFTNMQRYGAGIIGDFGVIFLLISTISFLYSHIIGGSERKYETV